MSINNIFSTIDVENTYVKSQGGYADFYGSEYGWFGSIASIDVEKGYKLRLPGGTDNITYDGAPAVTADHPLLLSAGWNWIGYVPQTETAINVGLTNLVNGTYIKAQTEGIADYYGSEYGWFGTLNHLKPSYMYMLNVSADENFVYTESTTILGRNSSTFDNKLDFDYKQYEFNGSITTEINIDNIEVSESDMLYAYIEGELRGQVSPLMFPLTNEYVFPIMIYGNESSTSQIDFEYYNSTSNEYYSIEKTIGFQPDMTVGNALSPYELYQDAVTDLPSSYSLGKIYPNPFNPTTTVDYSIGKAGHVNMVIYDVSGRIVDTLVDGYRNIGNYEIRWTANDCPSGVYFVSLNINGFTENSKLMLIK